MLQINNKYPVRGTHGVQELAAIYVGANKVWPIEFTTHIEYTVTTTVANTEVPIAMLRTQTQFGYAQVSYGDSTEQLIGVPVYAGTSSWVDSKGVTHFVDLGNTFSHVYATPGTYRVKIRTTSNIKHARFCRELTAGADGYMQPASNPFITAFHRFDTPDIDDLDYTFAGLVNCVVDPTFKINAPNVISMASSFHSFGINIETAKWSFPAGMLSEITLPESLTGTFFRCGIRKIEEGFLDSFVNVTSLFETFKYSKLGLAYYEGVSPWDWQNGYIPMAVEGTDDFIPVSLLWKLPLVTDINHIFNGLPDYYGNLQSGYSAYFVIRRELLWNGKEAGNANGTIDSAMYAFGKCNHILVEPNILKHCPNLISMGGMFTQTSITQHAIAFATMIPVAASETTRYAFSYDEETEEYSYTIETGKGLTNDLHVMFPATTYPNVTCITGAFTYEGAGKAGGFNRDLDYTASGNQVRKTQPLDITAMLAKFPNANAGSMTAFQKIIMGQVNGTETEKNDGRHGAFYKLNDTREVNVGSSPSLIFNNAIPY